jgi:hypothetical protein
MTLRPDCLTCYDTAFYHGDATKLKGSFGKVYPSVLCTCPAAVTWLDEGPRNGDFKLGEWDGYCHSIHPTHFTWYPKEGIWVALDFGIIDDTLMLWRLDLETLYSCEGSRRSTRYIKFASHDDMIIGAAKLAWVNRVEHERNAVYA